MAPQENGTKKRKRTRNTSADQQEMYINLMESDNVFRSGIINPTIHDNYVQTKWEELAILLNSSSEGPHMSADEWKKRFSDWKYSVRAKARKIMERMEHHNKTGSDPQIDIKLTPIEDKALSLWGKVVVTGTPFIDGYDGLPSLINQLPLTLQNYDNITVQCTADVLEEINSSPQILEDINRSNEFEPEPSCSTNENNTKKAKKSSTKKPTRRIRYRSKPLSALSEELINSSKNIENNQNTISSTLNNCFNDYLKYKYEELNEQKRKTNFEIASLKFLRANLT